ncbi:MAG: redoxin domain-containing protein [Gemmatimonadota bacterium]
MRIAALSLVALTAVHAQEPATPAAAAAQLRSMYLQQAYVDGWLEGEKLARRFPASPEVRAWYVVNYATSGLVEQAMDSARTLVRQHPRSPWSTMALSFAQARQVSRAHEAVPAARRALARAPNDPHLTLLYVQMLDRMGEFDRGLAYLDSIAPRFPRNAHLFAARGVLLRSYSRTLNADTSAGTRSRAAFADAIRLDSTNASILYLAASNTPAARGDTTNYVLLRKASQLSPSSTAINAAYWSALQARRDLSDSVRRAMGVADVERYLANRPNQAPFMYTSAGGFGTFGLPEKREELYDRLLHDYPTSRYAYLVRNNRLTAHRDSTRVLWDTTIKPRPTREDSIRLKANLRRALNEFIAQSYHYSLASLGDAYLTLYGELSQDSLNATNDEILAAIKGMVKYNTYNPQWTNYDAPMLLAERKLDLAYATELAKGYEAANERQMQGREKYTSIADLAESMDWVKAHKHDVLGWILFKAGRYEDAERELLAGREASPRVPNVHYHLGRVAEEQGRIVIAERHYSKGYQYETSGFRRGVLNATALKRLFEARTGSLTGFDAHVEQLKEEDRARRKEMISNSILKDPRDVPPFSLERLRLDSVIAGPRVSRDVFKGKIAVINFWGVWCGPCVAEMPQLQQFYERVKEDTSVVFLTVDYRDEVKTVRDWMNQKKFTMPVLLDDGWVTEKARINAYPTTWFVSPDGKTAFVHRGASDVVLEEFLWRVDMLKGGLKTGGRPVP